MTDQQPPKIEFPCDYEIRVLGKAAPDFKDFVCDVIKKHAEDYDGNYRVKPSTKGTFSSVMVTILCTGEPQLKAIYEELKASGRVQMVI